MTLSQFFIFFRARWKLAALIWGGVVVLVVGGSLLMSPKYTASAAVVIDNRPVDPVVGVQVGASSGYMATQVDVATSERVMRMAIRSLKLNESPELRESWTAVTEGRGDFETWLSDLLSSSYVVRPARESNVMQLSYTGADPRFVAAVTNALMQAYIDTTLELKVEPARLYSTFFDERSKQLREALEQTQTRLSAYQRANGLLATDERFDVENSRLSDLTAQVVSLQNLAAEAGGRLTESGSNPQRLQEVFSNPLVANLSAENARLEARLQEMRSRLGDSNPLVQEAQSGIAEVRTRMNAAIKTASQTVNVNTNVARVKLEQAQTALAAQRGKVLQLKAKRDEAAVLQRDVENAQRAYDMALARLSQTDTESQNRQSNVSVLRTATEPAFPSAPRTKLNAAVAVVLGALLACGAVIVRELADRRLRSEEDVLSLLHQPLLMTLPSVSPSRRGNSRLIQLKTRVLDGLPRASAS